jgi:hypothetical protein
MRKTSAMLALLLGLAAAGPARADVKFCNNWSRPIWITYGQFEWFSGAPCHVGNGTTDEIRGWWHPSPGQCVTVEVGCNCNWWANLFGNCPGPDLHYYAEDGFGTWWGGNQGWQTCTPWAAFDQCDNQWSSCPNGRFLTWGMWLHDDVCNLTFSFNP